MSRRLDDNLAVKRLRQVLESHNIEVTFWWDSFERIHWMALKYNGIKIYQGTIPDLEMIDNFDFKKAVYKE